MAKRFLEDTLVCRGVAFFAVKAVGKETDSGWILLGDVAGQGYTIVLYRLEITISIRGSYQ